MSREDDKVVSLEQRREQEAERKRAKAREAREAMRRRSLAEYGPRAVRTGRIIGRALGAIILLTGIAALAYWIWTMIPH